MKDYQIRARLRKYQNAARYLKALIPYDNDNIYSQAYNVCIDKMRELRRIAKPDLFTEIHPA